MPTANRLSSGLSGRDYFADLFRKDLAFEVEWLRRTAGHKADSIEQLLRNAGAAPESVLEIGAGTGAVIAELRRRGIGSRHYAVDFSEEAVGVLRQAHPDIAAATADVTDVPDPFGEGPYDVGVASHVVEHLEDPEGFLRALLDVPMDRLVLEVPLEDLFFGKVKAALKDRADHVAGHVQFFDRGSFLALVGRSGWHVDDVRVYAPVLSRETFAFAYGGRSVAKRSAKFATEYLLPRLLGNLWTGTYHAHYAVLCRKR